MDKKERENLKKQIIGNFLKLIEPKPEIKNDESVRDAYLALKKELY